ncbi:DUF1616 domain-containing protein [Halorientalis litorea]|uniref:DUF1616 domain-containing protein n=1 Tax=Halorientalis litorea TaxID=2931977 RepID=UPI001FF171AA|nr:DUF1616 domain-containing protein [Halorientalis litorea]
MKNIRLLLTRVFAVALVISAASFILIIAFPAPNDAGREYTKFYVVGPEGDASDYPTEVSPGSTTSLAIGISNYETESHSYTLTAAWNDTVIETQTVRVEYNDEIRKNITIQAPTQPGMYRLNLNLYKSEVDVGHEPYRDLRLLVSVRE